MKWGTKGYMKNKDENEVVMVGIGRTAETIQK